MAKFTIYSKDGAVKLKVAPKYSGTFMSPAFLVVNKIQSPTPITWEVGDYIDYRDGIRYKLYSIPAPIKNARNGSYGNAIEYSQVQFFAPSKDLEICPFRDLVPEDNGVHFTTLPDVATFEPLCTQASISGGTLDGIAGRIQACLNDLYPGQWEVRVEFPVSTAAGDDASKVIELYETPMNFSLSNGNVLGALNQIYSTWKFNNVGIGWIFSVENGKNILTIGRATLQTASNTTSVFEYGRGKGLKVIKKAISANNEIATRLFAYGSTRNMPSRHYNENYPDIKDAGSIYIPNLMIPVSHWGTTNGSPDPSKAYVENMVDKWGVRPKNIHFDGSGEWEEIYPSIEGVTAGMVRAGMNREDKHFPSTDFYADDSRLDEVVSSSPLYDDGSLNGDGKEELGREWATSGEETAITTRNGYALIDNLFAIEEPTLRGRYTITLPNSLFTIKGRNGEPFSTEHGEQFVNVTCRVKVKGVEKKLISTTIYAVDGVATYGGVSISFDSFTLDRISLDFEFDVPEAQITKRSVNSHWVIIKKIPSTFELTLKQIGFDISDCHSNLSNGLCTISFKDGMCAGRNFVLKDTPAYDSSNDTWVLTMYRQHDKTLGQYFPNNVFPVSEGNHFVILDIGMPNLYVEIASQRLWERANELKGYFVEQKHVYVPEIDDIQMQREVDADLEQSEGEELESRPGRVISEGMYFNLKDSEITNGVNEYVIIDTLTIDEDAPIPHYDVTLRDDKRIRNTSTFGIGRSLTTDGTSSAAEADIPDDETLDHSRLYNRNLLDQHPMRSITGLLEALEKAGLLELTPDGLAVTPKKGLGFITPSFISASSANPDAGTLPSTFDRVQMWEELRTPGSEQIDITHLADFRISLNLSQYLTTASLGDYALKADVTASLATTLETAKGYTDAKIADLIGGAPTTLDTLKEIADAIESGGTAMDALVNLVGLKADKTITINGYSLANDISLGIQDIVGLSDALAMVDLWEKTPDQLAVTPKGGLGIVTPSFMSARDADPDASVLPASFDVDIMWAYLNGEVEYTGSQLTQILADFIPMLDIGKINGLQNALNYKANASDLAGYLPLTGGMLSGGLMIDLPSGSSALKLNTAANENSIQFFRSKSFIGSFGIGKSNQSNTDLLFLSVTGDTPSMLLLTAAGEFNLQIDGVSKQVVHGHNLSRFIATASSVGFIKSGRDISVDESGLVTVNKAASLDYEEGTSDVYRHVWFSNTGGVGRLVYDNDFMYNPAINTLKLGSVIATGSVSAQSADPDASILGSSFDESAMWDALGTDISTKKILASYISDLSIGQITGLQGTLNAKADVSALSGYLPLTGGVLTGHINLSNNNIYSLNHLVFGDSGTLRSVSQTLQWNGNDVYHTGNFNPADYLPLTGGRLANTYHLLLELNNTTPGAIESNIRYLLNGSAKAATGYDYNKGAFLHSYPANKALWLSNDGKAYWGDEEIYHTGNLPSFVKTDGSVAMTGRLTITSGSDTKLIFNNTDGEKYTIISFRESGATYGELIFSETGLYEGGSKVLNAGNYSSYALPIIGGTMSGQILIPSAGDGVYGGALQIRERGYVLTEQDSWDYAPRISFHWGQRHVKTFGMAADGNFAIDGNQIIIHSGNIGEQSVANADTLDGYHRSISNNEIWGTIPYIGHDGVIELGRYIDFHMENTLSPDYSTRLSAAGNYSNHVQLPSASGVLALRTDNVASATKLQTPRTLWGQSFDGTGDVRGGLQGVSYILNNAIDGFYVGMGISTGMANGLGLYAYGDSNINFSTNDIERMRILSNGNVGIGTMSPEYKLDVNGDIRGNEVIATSPNAFRMAYGSYGALFRNDGGSLFLLITNSGNPYDGWNDFRPFRVDLSTSDVHINSSLRVIASTGDTCVKNLFPLESHIYNLGAASNVFEKAYIRVIDTATNYALYLRTSGENYVALNPGSESIDLYKDTNFSKLFCNTNDDNFGIFPHENNWNQIGADDRRWYRSYINNMFGAGLTLSGNAVVGGSVSARGADPDAAVIGLSTGNALADVRFDSISGNASSASIALNLYYEDGSEDVTNVHIPAATTSSSGLMTAADKTKLDNMSPGGGGEGGGEWYNIYNVKDFDFYNTGTSGANVLHLMIENYNHTIANNDNYRIVLLKFRKKHKNGRKWAMPMRMYELFMQGSASGTTNNDISFEDSWWPITGYDTTWFGQTGDTFDNVLPVSRKMISGNSKYVWIFKNTRNKKLIFGVAIYKNTGKGDIGWERVSNIAQVELFALDYSLYDSDNGYLVNLRP